MPVIDQPPGQVITDEKALEKLFRENYSRFLADAKKRLGNAAGTAPRVVSKAFHLAWIDRNRFRSMDELEAFLGANIQHGAARELSRLAGLHRIDSIEGAQKAGKHDVAEMSVDEAWDRLHHTLQGGAPEAYKARASAARHEAAEHVAALAVKRNWTPMIAGGAVGIALVLALIFVIKRVGEDRAVANALAAPDARFYETSFGQQVNITLDDGTAVRLGPESKLTIPKRFGLGFRAVKIDGTANFEVTQPAGDKAFEVRSGDAIITALGTVFTVRRYDSDSATILHVRQGTVELRLGEDSRKLTDGMSFAINKNAVMEVPSTEIVDETRTWVDGNVTIAGRTLRYVLPQLKRWYGLDIKVQDTTLLSRKVFMRAAANSPKEAIASVEKSGGLKFTYIGPNMAFEDTAASRRRR
jgi:ferric-dicitrate binding protein FerR (iron transport regulator)